MRIEAVDTLLQQPSCTQRGLGRSRWLLILVLATLALTLTDCGATSSAHSVTGMCNDYSNTTHGPSFPISCYVTFAPTVSYSQALRAVTDLGLQPILLCSPITSVQSNGQQVDAHVQWQPVGQRDAFQQSHGLVIDPTLLADPLGPHYWQTRLRDAPTVVALHDAWAENEVSGGGGAISTLPHVALNDITSAKGSATYTCPPPIVATSVTPTTPMLLTSGEAGAYARVSFAPTVNYDMALYAITNLGLRLADPCYETALLDPHSQTLPIEHQGQETGFATFHTLTVATSPAASTLWLQQARGSAGAVGVTPVTGSACAQ